jgi:hypothetical protein
MQRIVTWRVERGAAIRSSRPSDCISEGHLFGRGDTQTNYRERGRRTFVVGRAAIAGPTSSEPAMMKPPIRGVDPPPDRPDRDSIVPRLKFFRSSYGGQSCILVERTLETEY